MREIKVNEATFQQHATKVASKSLSWWMWWGVQQVTKQDASRLNKMDTAYAKQD